MKVLVLLALIISIPFVYQNCSKVNFVNDDSGSYEPLVKEDIDTAPVETDPVETGPTNGDGYTGKVTRYLQPTEVGECADGEAKGEIQEFSNLYHLVREECQSRQARVLEAAMIHISNGALEYDGKSFLRNYPRSCTEIYDLGGADGNGLYRIDSDGEGGADPADVYCDMTLAGQGWGPWTDWTECPCGGGEQQRERSCHSGNCQGESTQSRACERVCSP